MNKSIIPLTVTLSNMIKNSSFNFALSGWPAAVTASAICFAGVAIYALKVTHPYENIPGESPS